MPDQYIQSIPNSFIAPDFVSSFTIYVYNVISRPLCSWSFDMLLVFIITKQTQLVVKVTWIVKVSVLLKSLEVSACEKGFIKSNRLRFSSLSRAL